jgi:hypothetical protein
VEFSDEQVDALRALGVLFETDRSGYVTDKPALKQAMEDAALAYLPALRQLKEGEKEAKAEAKKAEREAKRDAPPDPYAELDADRKRKQRDHVVQARPANLALGDQLLRQAAVVDPASLDVAKLFVLCGRLHRTNYADRVAMPNDGRAGPGAARGWTSWPVEGRHSQPRLSR